MYLISFTHARFTKATQFPAIDHVLHIGSFHCVVLVTYGGLTAIFSEYTVLEADFKSMIIFLFLL